ncbi:hypothetical protein MNBD_GAMMA13-173 [hydrothermal vent metagenome]|uniref:Phospholipase D-like domain-containing protein n=1 Tax=hydrothermal vent metagenome TaxID=652676 RepID=A0A3B0YUA2_9ZZZZ
MKEACNLELFIEGDVLYQSMLASIASAQRRIQLESYIFADDEVGKRFIDVLVERAQAGVDVRLLVPRKSDVKVVCRSQNL